MTGGTTVSPPALSRLIEYIPRKVLTSVPHRADLSPVYETGLPNQRHASCNVCQGLSNAEMAGVWTLYSMVPELREIKSYFGINPEEH